MLFLFLTSSHYITNAFADGKLFKRSPVGIIHVEQLNAILHHDGFGNPTQINQPRAAHNLLGYELEYTNFTAGSTSTIWIGGPTPDPPARFALFKRYGIMNKEVMVEDEKRGGGAAVAVEVGKSKR